MSNYNSSISRSSYPFMLHEHTYGSFLDAPNSYPVMAGAHGDHFNERRQSGDFAEHIATQAPPQRTAPMTPRSDDSIHPGTPAASTGSVAETKARLRKACDSCSVRKVKCDEEGPPCRACAALEIPCTFDRPSRRRGPPNRHAEAIKKRRFETDSNFSPLDSPTSAAHTLASFSQQGYLSAESICPLSLLYPLVDDYFTYIHPLIPIPHEPTFREALRRRDDLHDPTFLSLLAAMIGCLVISFPRKPRRHLIAQHKENEFPSSLSLVDRCHKVAVESRGPGFLDKDLKVHDAAVSYLLGLTAGYGYRWRRCKLYFGECLLVLRALGIHKTKQPQSPTGSPRRDTAETGTNLIDREMGRRIFWVLFVGAKSIQQIGASYGEVFIPPETSNEPYPPLPVEVDDDYIFPDSIAPQPSNIIATTVGFNANVKVFRSYDTLSTIDMTYGIDSCVDWDRQKRIVKCCLLKCKLSLAELPQELQLQPRHPSGDFGSSIEEANAESSQYRRNIQYEIQKANIHITQLGTRSHIVEKYWALCERRQHHASNTSGYSQASFRTDKLSATDGQLNSTSSPQEGLGLDSPRLGHEPLHIALQTSGATTLDTDEDEMAQEREDIVKALLIVLKSISQENMEPNGGSLIHKIRLIAATLLDVPRNRKGTLARSAEQWLTAFLDILIKLEKTGGARSSHTSEAGVGSPGSGHDGSLSAFEGTQENEEAELGHWADMREFQRRYAQAGGVLSEI